MYHIDTCASGFSLLNSLFLSLSLSLSRSLALSDLAPRVNRLEERDDRILELVVQVILKVQRHVMLLDKLGILQHVCMRNLCV
jgi:hypothetical protein